MMLGLPLDLALKELSARGETAEVKFTRAPRRAAEKDETEGGARVARVIKYARGQLICAYFNEPKF